VSTATEMLELFMKYFVEKSKESSDILIKEYLNQAYLIFIKSINDYQ